MPILRDTVDHKYRFHIVISLRNTFLWPAAAISLTLDTHCIMCHILNNTYEVLVLFFSSVWATGSTKYGLVAIEYLFIFIFIAKMEFISVDSSEDDNSGDISL